MCSDVMSGGFNYLYYYVKGSCQSRLWSFGSTFPGSGGEVVTSILYGGCQLRFTLSSENSAHTCDSPIHAMGRCLGNLQLAFSLGGKRKSPPSSAQESPPLSIGKQNFSPPSHQYPKLNLLGARSLPLLDHASRATSFLFCLIF